MWPAFFILSLFLVVGWLSRKTATTTLLILFYIPFPLLISNLARTSYETGFWLNLNHNPCQIKFLSSSHPPPPQPYSTPIALQSGCSIPKTCLMLSMCLSFCLLWLVKLFFIPHPSPPLHIHMSNPQSEWSCLSHLSWVTCVITSQLSHCCPVWLVSFSQHPPVAAGCWGQSWEQPHSPVSLHKKEQFPTILLWDKSVHA